MCAFYYFTAEDELLLRTTRAQNTEMPLIIFLPCAAYDVCVGLDLRFKV